VKVGDSVRRMGGSKQQVSKGNST